MANLQSDVPLVNVPFVNGNGNINEVWFQFLIQLWRRTGNGSGNTGAITIDDVFGAEQTFSQLESAASDIGEMVLSPSIQDAVSPPEVLMVGESPFVYTATGRQGVHIAGGVVTALNYARGDTEVNLVPTVNELPKGGMYEMNEGDQITVTYSIVPVITIFPR